MVVPTGTPDGVAAPKTRELKLSLYVEVSSDIIVVPVCMGALYVTYSLGCCSTRISSFEEYLNIWLGPVEKSSIP